MSFRPSPLFLVLGSVAAVYGLICLDLTLRAKTAFQEGEKFMEWHRHPERRRAYFEARFEEEAGRLAAEKAAGRLTEPEHRQRLDLARFRKDEGIRDSCAKAAYHWFQTAAELFTPPENRWVRLSRERMVEAKRLWKAELDAAKVPYQDTMLE